MNRKEKATTKSGGFVDPQLSTDDHDEVMIWLHENIESVICEICPSAKDIKSKWEMPIIKGSHQYSSIVGYIDMTCQFSAIPNKSNSEDDRSFFNVAIEVKSRISNIGEVVRQINQYRAFFRADRFYICSPDDRFVSILESQNIGFIKAPDLHTKPIKEPDMAEMLGINL